MRNLQRIRAQNRCPFCAIRLEKTGRRLTSDPIRTSLGLLPSGPDPVGEWLVHRQSPGPYLGPKVRESKRGLRCGKGARTPHFVMAGLDGRVCGTTPCKAIETICPPTLPTG